MTIIPLHLIPCVVLIGLLLPYVQPIFLIFPYGFPDFSDAGSIVHYPRHFIVFFAAPDLSLSQAPLKPERNPVTRYSSGAFVPGVA